MNRVMYTNSYDGIKELNVVHETPKTITVEHQLSDSSYRCKMLKESSGVIIKDTWEEVRSEMIKNVNTNIERMKASITRQQETLKELKALKDPSKEVSE